jgi:hypothetical protein
MLSKNNVIKTVAALAGTVLVGAIGSGVWQHMLEPSLLLMRDAILNLTVFGITEFKNGIYVKVAQGLHEANSLEVYGLILYFQAIAFVMIGIWILLRTGEIRKDRERLMREVDSLGEGKRPERPSIEQIREELAAINIGRKMLLARINMIIVVLFATGVFLQMVRAQYINSSIRYFAQLTTIAGPYLDTAEATMLRSTFAQIEKKADYVAVVSRLERLVDAKGLKRPAFEPW